MSNSDEANKKHQTQSVYDQIYSIFEEARQANLIHITVENDRITGPELIIGGKSLLNFGWGGYLGLELDQRLIDGAVSAVKQFGVQFASSRAYISSPLYRSLHERLDVLFDQPVLITPTVTLGHQSCMPVAMGPEDAVFVDRRSHASMQTVIPALISNGVHIEILPHNDMVQLESKLASLGARYDKIWYVIDGLYSMHGDYAPIPKLVGLLDNYPNFHLYIDDAHAMSWMGEHGTGYAFQYTQKHPRTIVALSMAKAFGAGGGMFLIPDSDLRQRIRDCGGTMIFSGPIQNPVLGACIASADLHLSGEIHTMQAELRDLIAYCSQELAASNLGSVSATASPIFFVEIGRMSKTVPLMRQLMSMGYFANYAAFPAVAKDKSGVRFNVTRHHNKQQIHAFVEALSGLVNQR